MARPDDAEFAFAETRRPVSGRRAGRRAAAEVPDQPAGDGGSKERLVVGVAMDQLKPAVLAGGAHIGPTGGVGLVIPSMPAWAVTAVIVGWIGGWLAIGAWKMTTRDA